MMQTSEVLALLRAHKPRIMSQFGVKELALFGSFARGEATAASDLDILARFEGPATSRQYFKALRAELRPYIEREAVYV